MKLLAITAMATALAGCATAPSATTSAVAKPAAASAAAAQTPAEVKLVDGRFTDQAGKTLYTFNMDTMREMSHCEGRCAEAWPPLIAPAGAKATGAWYLIKRGDGQMQWAYKDKPLYTYAKDQAGAKPTGENDIWKVARP